MAISCSKRQVSKLSLDSGIWVRPPAVFVADHMSGVPRSSALKLQPASSNPSMILPGIFFSRLTWISFPTTAQAWPEEKGVLALLLSAPLRAKAVHAPHCHLSGAQCSFQALSSFLSFFLKQLVWNCVKTCRLISVSPVP